MSSFKLEEWPQENIIFRGGVGEWLGWGGAGVGEAIGKH